MRVEAVLRRLRFSLGGLMACVFAIAVGLTESRHEGAAWFDGLFAAVAAWGAVGLAQQARDLRRHFHGDPTLNAVQRSGVRFAISWRLLVVALLLGCFVLNRANLAVRVSASDQEVDSLICYLTDQLCCAAFVLLLLTVAATGRIRKSPSSIAKKLVEAAAMLAGTILGLIVWCGEMQGFHLVHVSCEWVTGVPARLLDPPIVPTLWSRSAPFFYASAAAIVLSAINFALVARFAKASRRSLQRLLGFFLFSVAATYAVAIWLATAGLRQTSPWLHAGRTAHPPYVWMLALLVLGLSTAFLAVRWSLVPWSDATASNNDWRRGRRYVHEGLFWHLLLAIGAGASLYYKAAYLLRWISDSVGFALFLAMRSRTPKIY